MSETADNSQAGGRCAPALGSGTLWTAVARCRVCGKEINRAEHVPESEKARVDVAAPLMALCDVRHHNTGSDFNLAFNLEWAPESPNDAHHWRRASGVRYLAERESRRPVHEPG